MTPLGEVERVNDAVVFFGGSLGRHLKWIFHRLEVSFNIFRSRAPSRRPARAPRPSEPAGKESIELLHSNAHPRRPWRGDDSSGSISHGPLARRARYGWLMRDEGRTEE